MIAGHGREYLEDGEKKKRLKTEVGRAEEGKMWTKRTY